MWILNSVLGGIFNLLFWPFQSLSPWAGMAAISLLTGILMLLIFRLTSNQKGIREVKNRIKAHLLELRLYKDNLNTSLKAQGKIFSANFKYLSYSLKPLLAMIIPLILIIIQLNLWFGYQPLKPGEKTLLKVKLKAGTNPLETDLALEPSEGIAVETPALRIEEDSEVDWRIRVKAEGVQELKIRAGKKIFTKVVSASPQKLAKISQAKASRGFLLELENPGEPPLPSDSPVESIGILYPSRSLNLFGWHIHWLIAYFGLSIIFGLALKGFFKVEI